MKSPFAIALANVPHFGPKTIARLFDGFANAEDAWKATGDELLAVGVRPRDISGFLRYRETTNLDELMALINRHHIKAVSIHDPEYPELLKLIPDPPTMFFLQGTLPPSTKKHLAVVGSREATQYGLQSARSLSFAAAQGGVIIVSGLAHGIDQAAHQATLDAQGITIAVLGSGLLGIDNTIHQAMVDKILASNGAIISEFPLYTGPRPHNFPQRNRIVSGISHATLVVEAALPSGSLITAKFAVEQNREVLAVPGPITSPKSKGTNDLIRTGCHVATEAQDIFDVLGMDVAPKAKAYATLPAGRSADEIALFAQLGAEPIHIDTAIEKAGLNPIKGSVATTTLEILGAIVDIGGKRFIRTSET